jgi:hypothetical protein
MAKQVYDASAIQALKGLEPVRRMPGMYTHTVHPLHIVQEAIDNAVDEALAGHGKRISVRVFKDGSVEVEDEGRGIPVDVHPVEKRPAVEVAFGMLHAGGKFSRSGEGVYHISGGLHGVGVAVSNALSRRLEVTVYRDGQKHTVAFEGGELKQKLKSERIKERRTGTVVRLWPDPKYFDAASIPMLAQLHPQRRIAHLELRQDFRQHVGGQCRDHAEPQPPGQRPPPMAGEVDKVTFGGEHLIGAPGDFGADLGQHRFARAPLDQFRPKLLFQRPNLHRQRRLGHRAGVRRPAEMPVLGECPKITELTQGEHRPIRYSYRMSDAI